MAKLNIVELIKGVVLEQLNIVEVHWSCPLALLYKVQRLPLAKQSGYTFKEALTHKNTLYCWLFGVGSDILSSPHFHHHMYYILITVSKIDVRMAKATKQSATHVTAELEKDKKKRHALVNSQSVVQPSSTSGGQLPPLSAEECALLYEHWGCYKC